MVIEGLLQRFVKMSTSLLDGAILCDVAVRSVIAAGRSTSEKDIRESRQKWSDVSRFVWATTV
jgi:hypothetical protein